MQARMAMVVEKSDADPAGARGHVEQTRRNRNPLLIARLLVPRSLGGQPPLTPCEVHGNDGPGEGERRDDTAADEQRLQAEGTDIRDEGHVGIGLSGIARAAFRQPVDEEREERDYPDGAAAKG